MKVKYFIFDLDDTLCYEIDYLISAYKEISKTLGNENLYEKMFDWYEKKIDVFERLEQLFNVSKKELLEKYRHHHPSIVLNDGAEYLLKQLKEEGHYLGLISDGRSITQRNKLKALNIEHFFDKIVISEEFGSTKPNSQNFEIFINQKTQSYYYIGDNINKDFLIPNSLGWYSICLIDGGKNIHKQNFTLEKEYLPHYTIKSLKEVVNFI